METVISPKSTLINIEGKNYNARDGFASLRFDKYSYRVGKKGISLFDFRVDTGWRLTKIEALPELIRLNWLTPKWACLIFTSIIRGFMIALYTLVGESTPTLSKVW